MGRIIGLDYGHKRVGIAVTDPLQIIASPLRVVAYHKLLPFLKSYLEKTSIEAIVVGWPVNLNGIKGATTRLVSRFVKLLQRYFPDMPIKSYDERFTSVLAKKSILQSGLKRADSRKKVPLDAISAAFMLHSFVERQHFLLKKRA